MCPHEGSKYGFDNGIGENNIKNCISDYAGVCSQNNTRLLEPNTRHMIVLENGSITRGIVV